MKYMAGSGPRAVPTVIQLDAEAMSKDDVTTSYLGTTLLAFTGVFVGKPAEGLKESVLMHTSPIVKLVDTANAMSRGEEAVRGFQPDGKEYPIALRLTGKFQTAFPDGRPVPKDPAGKEADGKDAKPAAADPGAALKEGQGEGTVVLVGDTDLLNDGAAVQIRDMFGQKVAIPINGNLAFIQALVEQMAGDADLINVRSRATASRPFTVVKQMEAEAAQAYLGKIKSLEENLQETRKKLESLQKTRAPAGGGAILSAEQQAEVENFRQRAADTRKELKEVRRELRSETEVARVLDQGLQHRRDAAPRRDRGHRHRDREAAAERRDGMTASSSLWSSPRSRCSSRRAWVFSRGSARATGGRQPSRPEADRRFQGGRRRHDRYRRVQRPGQHRPRRAGVDGEGARRLSRRRRADPRPAAQAPGLKVVQAEGLSDAVKPRLQLVAPGAGVKPEEAGTLRRAESARREAARDARAGEEDSSGTHKIAGLPSTASRAGATSGSPPTPSA